MTIGARILCRVVDNFGDAGVAWRLARQLAGEFGWRVTLVIDRPELLARLGAQADSPVRIEPWPAGSEASSLRPDDDVLVSAFGCEPPPQLRAALAGGPARPLWIHLEYLSAEPWIDGCHGLRTIRPDDGAIEHFYYPGFTERSGGLLRERSLLAQRTAFTGSPRQPDWLTRHGIARERGERLVTMFCYPDAPLAAWLAKVAEGARPHLVVAPDASADEALGAFFGHRLAPGQVGRRGRLRVLRIPFLPQDDYDRLLWSADLNFVRGEDSWIRAQWAARPFVWQPYVQSELAHHVKLEAFLERLAAGARTDAMMRAWSGAGALGPAWRDFEAALPTLETACADWAQRLAGPSDLATRLVEFCSERL